MIVKVPGGSSQIGKQSPHVLAKFSKAANKLAVFNTAALVAN